MYHFQLYTSLHNYSAFVLLVSTIIPIYFNYLAENAGISAADYLAFWGYAASAATIIVPLISPVFGTLADTQGLNIDRAERPIRRNPKIAQMLYYSKDIKSFGTGLKRIAEACDAAGVRYEFEKMKSGFVVCFYRSEEKADKS